MQPWSGSSSPFQAAKMFPSHWLAGQRASIKGNDNRRERERALTGPFLKYEGGLTDLEEVLSINLMENFNNKQVWTLTLPNHFGRQVSPCDGNYNEWMQYSVRRRTRRTRRRRTRRRRSRRRRRFSIALNNSNKKFPVYPIFVNVTSTCNRCCEWHQQKQRRSNTVE